MNTNYSFQIYFSSENLPSNWDVIALNNIFLSKDYLKILEKSAPENMICHFIGFFRDKELVGIALSQFLDLNKLESFGERDKCIKTSIRNSIFKNFCSHVLILGNNMLTGQNAYAFSDRIDKKTALLCLKTASKKLETIFKNKGQKVHITTFKDFPQEETAAFQNAKISYSAESESSDGLQMKLSGIEFAGSYLITQNLYGMLSYATASGEVTDGIDTLDIKMSGVGFSAGFRAPINDSMDAYGEFNISSPEATISFNGVDLFSMDFDYKNYNFGIAAYSDNIISKSGFSLMDLDGDKSSSIFSSTSIVLDNKVIVGVDLMYDLDASEFGWALHAGMSL